MSPIPAASVSGVDIERIRSTDPAAAADLVRIGNLMMTGDETEDDMLLLCRLLHKHGFTEKAELLLVANSSHGDRLHGLHQLLFGNVEEMYAMAVTELATQLGIDLALLRSPRLYSHIYTCSRAGAGRSSQSMDGCLPPDPVEVQITYEPGMGIIADIYPRFQPNSPPGGTIMLRYVDGSWHRDDSWQIRP